MRTTRLLPFSLLLAALALPVPAHADGFRQIFDDYKADGRLNQCYSPGDLQNASGKIPPDIEQYAPGFGDALSSAQAQCGSSQPAPAQADEPPTPVSAGTPGPDAPAGTTKKAVKEPPAPRPPAEVAAMLPDPRLHTTTAVAAETPGALIALLIAAGLALLLALGWSLAWVMGWSLERLTKPLAAAFQTVWDRLIPGR